MFNKNKIVTVGSIPQFLAAGREQAQPTVTHLDKFLLPVIIAQLALYKPTAIHAAALTTVSPTSVSEGTRNMIVHAFDPLIDLIQILSYPIAGVMIAGGCLMIMINQKDKGVEWIRGAAIGYIIVQLSPLLLKILVGVGGNILQQ